MTICLTRFDAIAAMFSHRVNATTAEFWDNPSHCEGWTARDIVGHLAEWVPAFLANQKRGQRRPLLLPEQRT